MPEASHFRTIVLEKLYTQVAACVAVSSAGKPISQLRIPTAFDLDVAPETAAQLKPNLTL
jgi:hypothetical protein